ncbi:MULTISPECIES: hypothetical protein [Acinetobacter]|uniref:hypothetical protein n=1 Tax=Acinetobacter TaxID=469 RepID=UPI001E57401B|nr:MULTISPECIES: hypothetical protein [Acinetobacter]
MDIQKEREAFNKEFGIDDADTFPAFSGGIESSAALKCNWLGWKKRAEFEYRENPETIEIDGLKTIHKLCKFGADHNMEGCTFTEIVERMFSKIEQMKTQVNTLDEMLLNQGEALAQAKAQAVPEGFVVVAKELPEKIAEKMAIDRIDKPIHENDPVWSEIAEESYKNQVKLKKWEFWRDYKAMIEAQEPAND